jgi:hypothetical protein
MTIDDKIAHAKSLIAERERIDRELTALFGKVEQPRRGRPPKSPLSDPPITSRTEVTTPTGSDAV